MPDTRTHRGPHPEDTQLFGPAALTRLSEATDDLCWLLSRGYAGKSALKLVGDRHKLVARQRTAVARGACSDTQRDDRLARRIAGEAIAGRALWLDGYNVLTTVEAALAGGVVLAARDGCYRDMASMHGSYRKVVETRPALELLGRELASFGPSECVWYLDRPVSNSGRLRAILLEMAGVHGWPWRVELVADPDPILADSPTAIATADSAILDRCGAWLNLAREAVVRQVSDAWIVELAGPTLPWKNSPQRH